MNGQAIYKLCCIALALWCLVSIVSKTPFLSNIEGNLRQAEKKWIGNKILAVCQDWQVSESQYAKIYYTEPDSDYIALMQRVADVYLPLLAADFSIEKDTKATVVVYATEESFRNAVGGGQRLPMGAYYGGIINILSPALWVHEEETAVKDRFLSAGPMIHELTHYAMDIKTGGDCEIWLTEGVALYYEYKYTGYEWRQDLQEKSGEVRFTSLRQNFRSIDEGLAYRRSFDLVKRMAESYGEAGLQTIIDRLTG